MGSWERARDFDDEDDDACAAVDREVKDWVKEWW